MESDTGHSGNPAAHPSKYDGATRLLAYSTSLSLSYSQILLYLWHHNFRDKHEKAAAAYGYRFSILLGTYHSRAGTLLPLVLLVLVGCRVVHDAAELVSSFLARQVGESARRAEIVRLEIASPTALETLKPRSGHNSSHAWAL